MAPDQPGGISARRRSKRGLCRTSKGLPVVAGPVVGLSRRLHRLLFVVVVLLMILGVALPPLLPHEAVVVAADDGVAVAVAVTYPRGATIPIPPRRSRRREGGIGCQCRGDGDALAASLGLCAALAQLGGGGGAAAGAALPSLGVDAGLAPLAAVVARLPAAASSLTPARGGENGARAWGGVDVEFRENESGT